VKIDEFVLLINSPHKQRGFIDPQDDGRVNKIPLNLKTLSLTQDDIPDSLDLSCIAQPRSTDLIRKQHGGNCVCGSSGYASCSGQRHAQSKFINAGL
jgi:hypothetical protein